MNEKPMAKEWGISYIANFRNERATEEIWMTCDTEEAALKGLEHFRESEQRGQLGNLRLHVRHVTEWEQINER